MYDGYTSRRNPGLVPTTDLGKNHHMTDEQMENRESLEIGKNYSPKRNKNLLLNPELNQKINNLGIHRELYHKQSNFNTITGVRKQL